MNEQEFNEFIDGFDIAYQTLDWDELVKWLKVALLNSKALDETKTINNNEQTKEVCEHIDTYYDDRCLGMVCRKCRCIIPD